MKNVDALLEDIPLVSEERHATGQAARTPARRPFRPLGEDPKYGAKLRRHVRRGSVADIDARRPADHLPQAFGRRGKMHGRAAA